MKTIYKALVDTLFQLGVIAIFFLVVTLIIQGLIILTTGVTISFEVQLVFLFILLGVATIGVLLIPIIIFYENYIYYKGKSK